MASVPLILGAKFIGDALEVRDLAQRTPRRGDDNFAGGRERGKALALADEYLEPELVLELPHLFADSGL